MTTDDECVKAFVEVEAFLREARRDQFAEALRLLACEVAYFGRYGKRSLHDKLTGQVSTANGDEETMWVVMEGMRHLAEVLARLRVSVPRRTPAPEVEPIAMKITETRESGWFAAGWVSYKGAARDAAHFPPMSAMEAQRWWLGGFGAAWVENIVRRVARDFAPMGQKGGCPPSLGFGSAKTSGQAGR